MTDPAHPGRALFVTMPVEDVGRTRAFFAQLGFGFDPAMSGEGAACMPVGANASVMFLERERWMEISKLPAGDPAAHALALYAIGVGSRDAVDEIGAAALAAGGREADGAEDHGFMYSRSFFDLDGHGWQVMWFDPAAAAAGSEASVA